MKSYRGFFILVGIGAVLGTLVWLFRIILILDGEIYGDLSQTLVVVGTFVGIAVAAFWLANLTNERIKEEEKKLSDKMAMERMQQQREQKHHRQQEETRQTLGQITSDALTILRNLPNDIQQAKRLVDQAESQFEEGLYSPFWDSIERAAIHLAQFEFGIRQIYLKCDVYKKEAIKLDAASPPLEVNPNALPSTRDNVERFESVVHEAHKSHEYDNIYEIRKNSRILVTGFENLGQAINDLGSRLELAISDLASTFSLESASSREDTRFLTTRVEALQQHLQSRDESRANYERRVERMLDDVRRGRKPLI